jgi:formimidoylglutamate deiminase
MKRHLASCALLPGGWARNVLLEVDDDGDLVTVRPDAASVDARRIPGIVLPGMINLHSHAFQRGMAGLAERGSRTPDSFWSWRVRMYDFLAHLTPEDVEAIAAQLYVEMLESGYTSVVEFHYLHHAPDGSAYSPAETMSEAILSAAADAGPGLTLLPTLYQSGGFGGASPDAGQRRFRSGTDSFLDIVGRLEARTREDPAVLVGLALHSLRAVPPEVLDAAVTAQSAETPIHIHVAEQLAEVEACLEHTGVRPVEWLLDHAPVDERWCLIHATHMSDDEVAAIARSGAVAGLCPTTEANLGDGVFRLREYLDRSGAFGVGSDSHVTVDPVAELRLLEYGQRLTLHERNVVVRGEDASSGRRLWEAAAAGGAQASGRAVGAIEPGRRADWITLDEETPALVAKTPDETLDTFVFFDGGARPVREVVVGGEVRVTDGFHPARNEVAERYRRTIRRLLAD